MKKSMKKSIKTLMQAIKSLPEELVSDDTSMAFTEDGGVVFNNPGFLPLMYREGSWYDIEDKDERAIQKESAVSIMTPLSSVCRSGHRFVYDASRNLMTCVVCGHFKTAGVN